MATSSTATIWNQPPVYGRQERIAATANLNYAAVLTAAKAGESKAFEQLCEPLLPRVLQTLLRITRNREDAEDALQDSLLSAFVNLRRFDGRASFATWLTRIAINAALMILRKKRTHRELPLEIPGDSGTADWHWDAEDQAPDPEMRCAQAERARLVRAAVLELRPSIRRVIDLRQMQERSMLETAKLMGISVGATKARLFQARAALRKSGKIKSIAGVRATRRTSLVHDDVLSRKAS